MIMRYFVRTWEEKEGWFHTGGVGWSTETLKTSGSLLNETCRERSWLCARRWELRREERSGLVGKGADSTKIVTATV